MRQGRRLGCGLVLALLAVPLVALGEHYEGNVEVVVSTMPFNQPSHGYVAAVALVANRGTKRDRTVRLELSSADYGYSALRSVSREVQVGPGMELNVLLPIPASLPGQIAECRVAVDGRGQMVSLPLRFSSTGILSTAYRGPMALEVLVSRRMSYDALERVLGAANGSGLELSLQRGDRELDAWPGQWIAYSGYDAVAVTGEEWARATEAVRDALWRYAECGGSLLVSGRFVPPGPWELASEQQDGRTPYRVLNVGLGQCVVSAVGQAIAPAVGTTLFDRMQRNSSQTWIRYGTAATSHELAPVIQEVKLPLGLSLAVLGLFAVVAGPVSMSMLRRWNRTIWLFWVTPALGLLTSLIILLSMLLGEGITPSARVEGVTVLDERVGRATSLAIDGFYCPLRPRQGLVYSYDTEVTACRVEDDPLYEQPKRDVVWDEGQQLRGDWVTSRVPTYFRLRTSELRNERLGVVRSEGGRLAVVNGLGATISRLVVQDFDGRVYEVKDIAAGVQTEPLTVSGMAVPAPRSLAEVLLWDEQWTEQRRDQLAWSGVLRPGSYLAYLDGAPFLPKGLGGTAKRQERSLVFGLMREEGRR